MTTFALIAEGMTDVAVVERIVEGVFGKDVGVNPLMPIRDATDAARAKTDTFSTWELVLEYVASEEVEIALATNDYLIIQIDSDQGEHPNFGISFHHEGATKSIADIVSDCKELLLARLHSNVPEEWKDRIIFAVPVLSTECWLLPILNEDHRHTPKTIVNCEKRISALNKGVIKKEYRSYSSAFKKYSKKSFLFKSADRVPCLKKFVDALNAVQLA